jgi:hypothetical protein
MERAWYYEAQKPEMQAELAQARIEMMQGQMQVAQQRLVLAGERLQLQEEKGKTAGAAPAAAAADRTALGYAKLGLDEKKAVNKAFTDAKGDGSIPQNWTILDFYTNVWNAVPTGGEAAPGPKPNINPNTGNPVRRFKFE